MKHLRKWKVLYRESTGETPAAPAMLSVISGSDIINVVVTGETIIIDNVRLRTGMRIAAFYDANLPVPAVISACSTRAELITSLRRNQQVILSYFDHSLTSDDNTLQLNIGPDHKRGHRAMASPICAARKNSELLVYYTTSTFSIPAQDNHRRKLLSSANTDTRPKQSLTRALFFTAGAGVLFFIS